MTDTSGRFDEHVGAKSLYHVLQFEFTATL